jgi:hypothetical protein
VALLFQTFTAKAMRKHGAPWWAASSHAGFLQSRWNSAIGARGLAIAWRPIPQAEAKDGPDDHWEQPGTLPRMMNHAQRDALGGYTARALAAAPGRVVADAAD